MSHLFIKTRRDPVKDETSRNAALLMRAGFIHKEFAGVYTYLPLGLRTLKNIEGIIREEMNALGGQEVLMTTLQNPEIWKKSGRWNDSEMDNWFKTTLKNGSELGIANTHEEALAALLTEHVQSYKDLPLSIYQFQNKFRNELRAKSGIMRTREFIMKDLYSFSRNEEEFRMFYETCAEAYLRIFERVGLGGRTVRAFASGGSFSRFSDEFQTESTAGEDTIYIHDEKRIAVNKEVYAPDVLRDLQLAEEELREAKSIEVGNIFPLGTKYSEALGLWYRDENGEEKPVVMGSYGIGLGRLMGTIAEVLSDEQGLVWPASVAPYQAHVIALDGKDSEALAVIKELDKYNVDALYDDRADKSAGEKFADADLLGIPWRVVVSKKTAEKEAVEMRQRGSREIELIPRRKAGEKIMRSRK
jgi:prolyl-tRNA synthetase